MHYLEKLKSKLKELSLNEVIKIPRFDNVKTDSLAQLVFGIGDVKGSMPIE